MSSLVSNKGFSGIDGYIGASDYINIATGTVAGGQLYMNDGNVKIKLYDIEYKMPACLADTLLTIELLSKIVDYKEFIETLRRYKANIVTSDNKTLFESGIPVPGEWREDINQYIQDMLQMEEALE